ncbi:hypothetical protein [Nocardia sp. NPDC050412]
MSERIGDTAIATEPNVGEADVSERTVDAAPSVATEPSAGEAES